ncbi:glucosyltransferase [Allostella sp. ATCC 35155]|nr:glucosyltransferase [Stella sp. ATCC 35155]
MIVRRVLFVAIGSLGDVDPYLAIAQALIRRGHRATIASLDRHERAIRSVGAEFAHAQPDCLPDSPEDLIRKAFSEPGQALRALVRELVLDQLDASFAAALPLVRTHDIAVLHPSAVGAGLAAETLQRPWLGTVISPSALRSTRAPSVQPLPIQLRGASPSAVNSYFAELMMPWHAARARIGLPPRPARFMAIAPLGTLGLFSRHFAADPGDWPQDLSIVGFCRHVPDADPDEWRRALAFLSAGPPPVIFTQGSHSPSLGDRFFRASLQAARQHGLRALLIGRTATELGVAEGTQFACFARLPYGLAFLHARAVVTHAGMGTLARAIEAGRPILAVPSAVLDQPDNAYRANRLGVAPVLPLSRYDDRNAAAALAHLLGEPRYGEAARRMCAAMAQDGDGATAAADAILAAIDRRPPRLGMGRA